MPSKTEIASLAGTWVAAAIALVALVGIVGPIVIWRASRTEHHKAIDKLSEGNAETGGYVSQGVRVSRSIRLFRQLRAPDLRSPPSLAGRSLAWNDKIAHVSPESASWIQFGKVLEAYQMKFPTTRAAVIHGGQTWLPVHRSWLLAIGLLGRFGRRKDEGKLKVHLSTGIASTQARPGAPLLKRDTNPYIGRYLMSANADLTRMHKVRSRESKVPRYGVHTLYGLTGILHVSKSAHDDESPIPQVAVELSFTSHRSSEIGVLAPDSLDVGKLFWLALGCLPTAGPRVFSMDDVEILELDIEEPEPALQQTPRGTRAAEYRMDRTPRVRRSRNSWSSSDSSDESIHIKVPHTLPEKATPGAPRLLQLSVVRERLGDLEGLASDAMFDPAREAEIYSLEEIQCTEQITARLIKVMGTTYMPLDLPWVRLLSDSAETNWVLRRQDAQLLAQALLHLPMSPLGYLVNVKKPSKCRQLLCSATQSVPQLLVRIAQSLDLFNLAEEQNKALLQAMDRFFIRIMNAEQTRLAYETLFELDRCVATVIHADSKVNDAIGILMLTNEEFRDLIAQSARHIEESINTSVEVDFVGGTVNVPAVMGFIQKFPVDFKVIYPELQKNITPVKVGYCEVIFAVLKAGLRSAFLDTSLDSSPLFKAVLEIDNIARMG